MIKLPRLLDSQMQEVRPLRPSALTATMNLTPLSVASMTLAQGEPELGLRQFVEIYKGTESLGVFRTTGGAPGTGPRDGIKMEHALCTLGDDVTDSGATLTGTPKAILTAILRHQSTTRWVLGSAPDVGDYSLEVDRTKLLKAINDAVKLFHGYAISTDQSAYPWTLNLMPLTAEATSECRLSRNMAGVSITMSDSDLCTRVYAAPLPGGYLDADTVSNWGVVAEDLGVADDADAAKTLAYANEVLDSRKNPTISIEIDAVDLSKHTGEALDRFALGGLCRVALPDWSITANERIIAMRYVDLLSSPDSVHLTLSTAPREASKWLSELRNSTRSISRSTIRNSSSIRTTVTRLEDTAEYVKYVDGELAIFENYVGVQLNAIDAELILKASQTRVDELGEDVSVVEIRLDGAEAEIEAKVNKNGVVSAINLSPEEVLIQSAKINLSGYVTASQLSAEIASLENALAWNLTTSNVHATSATITSDLTVGQTNASWKSKSVVTGVTFPTLKYETIYYKNAVGDTKSTTVVVGLSSAGSTSKSGMDYLGA